MKFKKLESLDGMLDISPEYHKEDDTYGIRLEIKYDYRRKLDDRYKLDTDFEFMEYLSFTNDILNQLEKELKVKLIDTCKETINKLEEELYINIDRIKGIFNEQDISSVQNIKFDRGDELLKVKLELTDGQSLVIELHHNEMKDMNEDMILEYIKGKIDNNKGYIAQYEK